MENSCMSSMSATETMYSVHEHMDSNYSIAMPVEYSLQDNEYFVDYSTVNDYYITLPVEYCDVSNAYSADSGVVNNHYELEQEQSQLHSEFTAQPVVSERGGTNEQYSNSYCNNVKQDVVVRVEGSHNPAQTVEEIASTLAGRLRGALRR